MNNLFIGTSGYDYPEWKGVFYPQELKRKDFLQYYATEFNALELNYCFYSMPKVEQVWSFIERSEGKVNFSMKANRLLTHEVDGNWETVCKDYQKAVKPMLEKNLLNSILFQFPQSFHYTPENRIYLSKLLSSFEEFPTVVEFRHEEWIKKSVFEGLLKRNVSVAFCDMPQLKHLPNSQSSANLYTQFVGKQAYIRLHGRNANAWYCNDNSPNGSSRYNYDYSDNELLQFVDIIKAAIIEGRKVTVFFNNHPQGSGAKNAKSLKKMCESQIKLN